MATRERFDVVAALPSARGHLHVAVDRGTRPPRAVVLALYPREVSEDPGRLGRLSGDVERAARLFHPNVLAPVGIEPVESDLAAVTVWRDAVSLREVLDAGGRLPSDVAARIAADVCAGLDHAHGRPEPVVHGALRPEAILIGPDGVAAVSGFGMPGRAAAADDLRGAGALLYECLAGEPPPDPVRALDDPGVAAALAAVVDRALAADAAARYPSAAAMAEGVSKAVSPAPHAAVASYVDAILPVEEGERAARRSRVDDALAAALASAAGPEEISEDAIVGAATPLPQDLVARTAAGDPTPSPAAVEDDLIVGEITPDPTKEGPPSALSRPSPRPPPAPDVEPTPMPQAGGGEAARTIPIPAPPRRHRAPLIAAAVMGAAGFALGLWLAANLPPATPNPTAAGAPAPTATATPAPTATAPPPPTAPPTPSPTASPPPPKRAPPPGKPSVAIPADPPGDVYVDGRKVGRTPLTVAVAKGTREIRLRDPGRGLDVRRRVDVRGPATAVRFQVGTGLLDVNAPDGAEVWLDGHRIATGSVARLEIYEGDHRIEVRHRGAKVGEPFHLDAGETFTYAVSPSVR
ncbi:MAG TPA: PEGA domain-containing protein [Anaeromyxobacteraceae bacterium]|nr:PEGA domain-containing protein [Anaeromyxobacteraceae bacterium]